MDKQNNESLFKSYFKLQTYKKMSEFWLVKRANKNAWFFSVG
ncbi:hypothetical protein T190130A13A_40210 [Tenacibaculum sp. 190130A14a]|uniref:Uncharacterized protein n=1 Tax=Tenacibaculum polynesiense TaxID=3137857 RepID=A0ABM9PDD3_9FLAO